MHYYDKHPNKSQRFMDVFPIFTSPRATEIVIADFLAHIHSEYDIQKQVGVVVGPEAEGFLLGPLVATRLGIPFVPARKQGKLPGDILREKYRKWASEDVLEMQAGAFDEVDTSKGAIIIDDSGKSGSSI
jgi:adenine phosphoribosyltransferase